MAGGSATPAAVHRRACRPTQVAATAASPRWDGSASGATLHSLGPMAGPRVGVHDSVPQRTRLPQGQDYHLCCCASLAAKPRLAAHQLPAASSCPRWGAGWVGGLGRIWRGAPHGLHAHPQPAGPVGPGIPAQTSLGYHPDGVGVVGVHPCSWCRYRPPVRPDKCLSRGSGPENGDADVLPGYPGSPRSCWPVCPPAGADGVVDWTSCAGPHRLLALALPARLVPAPGAPPAASAGR